MNLQDDTFVSINILSLFDNNTVEKKVMLLKEFKVVLAFVYNVNMAVTMEDIGVCIIASVLRKNGHKVMLFSASEKEVDYEQIVDFKPDIVGFPVYQMSNDSVNRVSRKIKLLLPETMICIGGVYTTYNSNTMMEENEVIDFAIRGEGEETFTELLDKLSSNEKLNSIAGLSYREGNKIIVNENRELISDMDTVPFPARDILVDKGLKIALISTSRGCYSNCFFCSTQLFWKKWRGRSTKNVVDELQFIVNDYGVNVFNFIDSSFEDPYKDLRRAREIAEEIVKRNLFISYFVDIRAEFHRKVTPEIMELLVESGLCAVCIGIEAGNEADLKLYNKIATVDDNYKVMDLFKKYDISISPGFINFNPYTTIDRLKDNMKFLKRYGYFTGFFTYLDIYKGTVIYNKIEGDGLLTYEANSKFKYKFCDEKIGKFAEYIIDMKNELDAKYDRAFIKLNFYTKNYLHLLRHYKRTLNINNNSNGLKLLEEHRKECEDILNDFTSECAKWIEELVCIVENGWNIERIDACTRSMMPSEKFVDSVKRLDALREKLYLKLSRLGHWSMLINV